MTQISKKPPANPSVESVQLELFGSWITNDPAGVSNTVEIWETIPKYFFTRDIVKNLRTPTGHADPYRFEFERKRQGRGQEAAQQYGV